MLSIQHESVLLYIDRQHFSNTYGTRYQELTWPPMLSSTSTNHKDRASQGHVVHYYEDRFHVGLRKKCCIFILVFRSQITNFKTVILSVSNITSDQIDDHVRCSYLVA